MRTLRWWLLLAVLATAGWARAGGGAGVASGQEYTRHAKFVTWSE